jgi:hypothetical protein
MQSSFTLHEDAWLRDGPVFASGQVTGYRVGGMPDGKTARIANFGAPNRNDWRIMRINADNTQTDWTGHFESMEDALADLQRDYEYTSRLRCSIALVLTRNLESDEKHLDFGEFTLELVGLRFKELRATFSSADVNQDDWVCEKSYSDPPDGPYGSAVGGIPNDIEDLLLLLRLFKVGDIAFVRQAFILPNGQKLNQFPNRVMNDVNGYSRLHFQLGMDECNAWNDFAEQIRASLSWNSKWFAVAKRYFLYGGAKDFNPRWDAVDRIVDYATALEAALVPEGDFSKRRMTRRAALLVSQEPAIQDAVSKTVKELYNVRSSTVHGTPLDDQRRTWLTENWRQFELRVRQVLVAAVQSVPADDTERCKILAALYDPTDDDRGESALHKFREIRTEVVRKNVGEKIGRLLNG